MHNDPFDRPLAPKKGCANCRSHSKLKRRKALSVGDGELELVEFADEPQVVFLCRHTSLAGRTKEMGLKGDDPAPGSDCDLWEEGEKGGLDPKLAKLLDRRGLG